MNKFEARSTLGSEAVPVFDDDGELTEWLHRDNYTVEELELMNFVGDEKPVIKKDGVKIIRDGTVIRRTNTETRKTEFLFIREWQITYCLQSRRWRNNGNVNI